MLIRSADKTKIVNFNTTHLIEIGECEEDQSCRIYVDSRYMGEYKSERRAIEVLDEICRTYEELNYVDRDTARGIVMNGIYQMPEE